MHNFLWVPIFTQFSHFLKQKYISKKCAKSKLNAWREFFWIQNVMYSFFCMKKKIFLYIKHYNVATVFLIYAIVPKLCISTPICANYIYFLLKISNMSDIVTIFLHKMYIPIILYKIFCFKLNVFVNISYVSDACLYF